MQVPSNWLQTTFGPRRKLVAGVAQELSPGLALDLPPGWSVPPGWQYVGAVTPPVSQALNAAPMTELPGTISGTFWVWQQASVGGHTYARLTPPPLPSGTFTQYYEWVGGDVLRPANPPYPRPHLPQPVSIPHRVAFAGVGALRPANPILRPSVPVIAPCPAGQVVDLVTGQCVPSPATPSCVWAPIGDLQAAIAAVQGAPVTANPWPGGPGGPTPNNATVTWQQYTSPGYGWTLGLLTVTYTTGAPTSRQYYLYQC
jgi:hypothetical protein